MTERQTAGEAEMEQVGKKSDRQDETPISAPKAVL